MEFTPSNIVISMAPLSAEELLLYRILYRFAILLFIIVKCCFLAHVMVRLQHG